MRAPMHHVALSATLLLPFLTPFAAADVVTTTDGLKIEDTAVVHCDRPSRAGDTISVHYAGTLENGVEFDSSYKRQQPFTFKLGAHQVITGWDKGLEGLCVGGKRKLTIPPSLAYGSRNMGSIPSNSVLIFDTQLIHIDGVPDPPTQPDPASTPTAEVKPEGASVQPSKSASSTTEPSKTASSETAPSKTEPPQTVASQIEKPAEENEPHDKEKEPAPQGDEKGPKEETNGECRLLGPFALFVQSALGVLALLSLVFKRWRERPRRPLQIWFFDVSKQVVGTALLHVANLAMSMLSSGIDASAQAAKIAAASKGEDDKMPNPCSFYLLNLAIDTTIGIPILVVLLRLLHAIFARTPLANPPESLKSGHYGTPPHVTWWIKQSFIYFIGLFGMKLFVLFMFQALPWLPWVGDWALRWTEGNESVQIAFVMFLFPLAMNAIQYYIIDTFIKEKHEGYQSVHQNDEGNEDGERERLARGSQDDEEEDDEDKPGPTISARVDQGESSGSDRSRRIQ